ncbi:MAG: hypothetical protein MAG431_00496 [Chloroflexi bacterium]|nr:hypothetical protein [Chloroflexota bacterium]
MATSRINTDSLLAIDIGAISTRALLFDVVNGQYRFLASGEAPSTVGTPFYNVGEGIRRAMDNLTTATGRKLISSNESLIMPSLPDNSGVDALVATISAGEPLKIVAVGLLEDITLASTRNLAATTYAQVVDTIKLNDRRQTSDRINTLMRVRPDVVIVAGGTDDGASQSVLELVEAIGLASYLSSKEQSPYILFAGNQKIQAQVRSSLEGVGKFHIAPNIRPALNLETISPAQRELTAIFKGIRKAQIGGIGDLLSWSGNYLTPTSGAFARVIRFLSKKYDPDKGVLGVDIGSQSTTVAAAFNGKETLRVYPYLGVGTGSVKTLRESKLDGIMRWLPFDISKDAVQNYIYNKQAHPHSLPVTKKELAIEQALGRQALLLAVGSTLPDFPSDTPRLAPALLPVVEPIIAAGSVISKAPTPGQALLMLLDGIQPTGVTTMVVDQNNLSAALGAAARINPLLTVQVLESSTFLNLGTIIAPVGYARFGTPVLRVRMTNKSGAETTREIKYGKLEVLPVKMGERVKLHLRPLHQFDVGMGGPGKAGEVQAVGGAAGIVIDARGRPLHLSQDPKRRKKLVQRWYRALETKV